MRIFLVLLILAMPFTVPAHETTEGLAWGMYNAGRICFENYSTLDQSEQLESCLRIQNTCYGIFHGLGQDKNRKWMTEYPAVSDYIKKSGLEPRDYCHIMRIITEEHSKPKEE